MKLDSLNSCSSKNVLILKTFSIKKNNFSNFAKMWGKMGLRGKMGHLGESWGMANTFLLGLIDTTYMHDLKSLVYNHRKQVAYY